MPDLENQLFKYCVGVGSGLGKVKNKKSTWERFTQQFHSENVMVDTACTFAQYQALDQDAKLPKKRAPGNWMAAQFREGKRKLTHITGRSMVVFDLDYVTPGQLDGIRYGATDLSQYAWIMHTTRAHCPEAPRVRLIVPVDRLMNAEETNAVTRLLALYLADDPDEAIEIPDLVSMRYNQTMFLPGRSRDQEYWMDRNDGLVLDVDEFLAENPGWDDFALLPYQEAEKQRAVADPNRKMEDPRDKKGLIGAWCRTYSVEEVIEEFLDDIYAPGDSTGTDTRYTYLGGSASNGAVVYDDGLILHSNHGTDPIEGSANAWDLVRIHKFGHLDIDAPSNTLLSNLPSSKRMWEFAQADTNVAAEMSANIAQEWDEDDEEDDAEGPTDTPAETSRKKPSRPTADKEIDDLLGGGDDDEEPEEDDESGGWDPDPDEDGDDDDDDDDEPEDKPKKKKKDMSWTANFRRKATGDLEPVLNNIALICENDPRIKRAVAFNEFTQDPVCLRPITSKLITLPSRKLRKDELKRGRRWEDRDDASISIIASANAARNGYETDFSDAAIQKAVLAAGVHNTLHPVKDDIEPCWEQWKAEGSPTGYIDRLAIDYFGCPDTIFHRESSTEFLVGAIARIYEPGCKFDQMLILEGATGAGKSTFLKHLAMGHAGEFRVDLEKIDRAVEAMRGVWFCEMAEMAKAKHSDANALKDFLSAQMDKIRLAYGKRELEFPRQSVMVGTSNDNDYLSDPTSVRRYWVWKVAAMLDEFNQIDQARLLANRHRIWGEAYQTYLDRRAAQPRGELHLGLKSREAILEQRQIAEGSRRQTATEAIAESVIEWLDTPISRDEMEVQATNPGGWDFDDEDPGGVKYVRNMVTAKQAFEALRLEPVLQPYRNADVRTFGKALKLVSGWTEMGKVRRHGTKAPWFYRQKDGPEWVESGVSGGGDSLTGDDDLLS